MEKELKPKELTIKQDPPSWFKKAFDLTEKMIPKESTLIVEEYSQNYVKHIYLQAGQDGEAPLCLHFNYAWEPSEQAVIFQLNQNHLNAKLK